jgi:hypothetical protein
MRDKEPDATSSNDSYAIDPRNTLVIRQRQLKSMTKTVSGLSTARLTSSGQVVALPTLRPEWNPAIPESGSQKPMRKRVTNSLPVHDALYLGENSSPTDKFIVD